MPVTLKGSTSGDVTLTAPAVAGNSTITLPATGGTAYTTTNSVGTVSQSGGTPTGAVVQSGSNANGYYVRFIDGTQICTGDINITPSAANTPTSTTWTFPIAFSASPNVQVSAATVVPGTVVTGWSSSSATATNTLIWVTRTSTSATGLYATAIGRWF